MASVPEWILQLVDVILDNMALEDVSGTWHYWEKEPDAQNPDWHVDLYPTPYEIEGGKEDGAEKVSGFELDLGAVAAQFDTTPSILWNVPSYETTAEDGLGVTFIGKYHGRQLTLRIFADPCTNAEPTTIFNPVTSQVRSKEARDDPETGS